MYDMGHCIHICVFDFLHTLAFVSASDFGKYICGLFGKMSHFFYQNALINFK